LQTTFVQGSFWQSPVAALHPKEQGVSLWLNEQEPFIELQNPPL
jgi:hypothetical protein